MYIKANSDNSIHTFPYSLADLKSDNPTVSFPRKLTSSLLADWNVYIVRTDIPDHDDRYQTVTPSDTPVLVDGTWVLSYSVSNLSEIAASENTRSTRDSLLEDTDVYALSDRTMSSEMTAYRQALRDIPSQSGFPFNVTWPTKP